MNFAKYAARIKKSLTDSSGQELQVLGRGWSDRSLSEARAMAEDRALKQIELVKSGSFPSERYPYADAPVCEELIKEIPGGLITRNSYGALVLNCSQALFIDVDIPASSPGLVAKFFGKKSAQDRYLQKLQIWAEANSVLVEAYATAGGLRLLITNKEFDPQSSSTAAIFTELQADPLYIRLCKTQKSFRARLTPKYWRCGIKRPPLSYPWLDFDSESKFRNWERHYAEVIQKFKTCRHIGQFGRGRASLELQKLKTIHDDYVLGAESSPLA